MAPNARNRHPAPSNNDAPANDTANSWPTAMGRPHRTFRDHVVTHIARHVHSDEALISLAQCLQRDVGVLRRWVAEDVPGFSFTPKGAPASDTGPGHALAEFHLALQERQTAVMVDALREHVGEMTLGDLQTLLSGEFGRRLEWVRMRDLNMNAPPRPSPLVPPARREAPELDPDEQYAHNLRRYLEGHPGWHLAKDLRRHLGDPGRFQDATQSLLRRGVIVRRGKYKTLEYARKHQAIEE